VTYARGLLKKQEYGNVTILEKTDRIGGKSLTYVREGVPYEMGTCFLHNGYHRMSPLEKPDFLPKLIQVTRLKKSGF